MIGQKSLRNNLMDGLLQLIHHSPARGMHLRKLLETSQCKKLELVVSNAPGAFTPCFKLTTYEESVVFWEDIQLHEEKKPEKPKE